jgi:hypothetical protein
MRTRVIGIVVALVVFGGVIYHARNASHTSPSAAASSHRQLEVGEQNGGVAYGDSAAQVMTKVGSPATKHGSCWSYSARAHTVNGEYLGPFVDGLRYCFGDGPAGGSVVTAIYEHIVAHTLPSGKWYPGGWNYAMTLMPPGREQPQV